MNILFFLTPKEEVAHVEEDDTLRQVVEKLEYHGYSAIPLLALDGKYIGTITEGDRSLFRFFNVASTATPNAFLSIVSTKLAIS